MAKKKDAKKKFSDPKEVLELHAFAKEQYTEAVTESESIEKLVFGEWEAPQDVGDSPPPHRPGKPRAIVDNFRRNLSANIGSDMEIKVLPLKAGDAEERKCSKLEWGLDGYDRELEWESDRDYKRDAIFWYVLRGRAYLEQRYRPGYAGDCLPYETIVDDPNLIYPVRGRRGIRWYTKEYEIFAGEVRKMTKPPKWIGDYDDNDRIPVVEYLDDCRYAAVNTENGEFIHSALPEYGFVPIAEAHCMDTPLADARYMFASVIAPVMDELKLQAELAEKMRTGVRFYFYPYMFGVSATGQPFVFNIAEPGVAQQMAPGSKLEQVNVNVNHAMFSQLFQYAQSDINLATMPESTFGAEPQSLESGFAISQVLNQSRMAILDKIPNLERALARNYSNILRLVKQFGAVAPLQVHADYDE